MDRSASSYLNGVSVKISEKYRPPRRPNFPPGLSLEPPSYLFCQEIDSTDDASALQLVDSLRKQHASVRLERKLRIAALKSEVEDEKEMENIKEDISLNTATSNSIPQQPIVPATVLHNNSSNGPLLPQHTQTSSMTTVLTPIQSSTVEERKKVQNKAAINLAEFESYSTNPFEEMELKTLNDKEELAMLLQPSAAPKLAYGLQYQSFNPTWPSRMPETYHPADPAAVQQLQYSTAAHTHWTIPKENTVLKNNYILEHRMEKMVIGNGSVPTGGYPIPPLANGNLRQAKSVPDLSEMPTNGVPSNYSTSTVFPDKRLSSRTPPPRLTSNDCISKPISLNNPTSDMLPSSHSVEKNLNAAEKRLLESLNGMGFPRHKCARAIKRLGATEKDVVDQLLLIQKFEDLGHSLETIESTLELLKPTGSANAQEWPKQLEQHLQLSQQLSSLGFERRKIDSALLAAGHDRDKALDILLMM